MSNITQNTFMGGMNKDLDKGIIPTNKYLDANNYRIVTTEGSTTGSLENVKGTKLILDTLELGVDTITLSHTYLVVKDHLHYNGVQVNVGSTFVGVMGVTTWTGDGLPIDITNNVVDGKICGGVQLRDKIILFVTENTSATPVVGDGDSRIYSLTLDLSTETQGTLTLLYDDSLNADNSDLCFSTANPIRAIAKYETPNVQKTYFTDGYNNYRYANVAANLTVDGTAYSAPGDYMTVDKFECLPKFTATKPVLKDIVSGSVDTGVIAYAYQLYILNGAETAFSPLSDPIHVTATNDFASDTRNYKGAETKINSGKGFTLDIDNSDNDGYNRLRLVRIHYSFINSVPEIFIVSEIEISPTGGVITITDNGDVSGELTIDEFNLASTELFVCQDIATKDNLLFAANIEKQEFNVSDWDSRAVRFKRWTANPDDESEYEDYAHGVGGVTVAYSSDNIIDVTITGMDADLGVVAPDYIISISEVRWLNGTPVSGLYTDTGGPGNAFSSLHNNMTVSAGPIYTSAAGGTVSFSLAKTVGDYFTDYVSLQTCALTQFGFVFTWNAEDIKATVTDGSLASAVITKPGADTPAGWQAAGWTDLNFPTEHDAINNYNDTDNDGNESYAYKYQSNATTPGAEGLNIKIDFESEDFFLDTSNDDTTFYVTPPSTGDDLSYKNYASPWKSGRLSFQRDEVYRLFIVFGNDRGQTSEAKWITDLRFPSLHDDDFANSSAVTVTPSKIATIDGSGYVVSSRLYARVYLKSFPTNATWAQIYRVKRERKDRYVTTQGFAVPCYVAAGIYRPEIYPETILPNAGELFKFLSPELSITSNISYRAGDYLDYVCNYHTNVTNRATTYLEDPIVNNSTAVKCFNAVKVPWSSSVITDIDEAVNVSPAAAETDSIVTVDSKSFNNYYFNGIANVGAKGGTGLVIAYHDATWAAETKSCVVVNYKNNVFNSQYGGNTYEDRMANVAIPCSDVITSGNVVGGILHWNDINYGDTFINYFDVNSLLIDLNMTTIENSASSSIYLPVESSINLDLRSCPEQCHSYTVVNTDAYRSTLLRQEYSGKHEIAGGAYEFNQTKNLYLYNTVYSQSIDAKATVSLISDVILETDFDCMVKASNPKSNGEITDSWTKFPINEFIEVDSIHGPINSLHNLNGNLYYFQDKAFGLLSVNERTLITDANSAELILGTGGILDRYNYISLLYGCKDKFSICNSSDSMYWYDRVNNFIMKHSKIFDRLSLAKGIQSYLNNNVLTTQEVLSHYDSNNNEVLFTFYIGGTGATATAFTLAYSDVTDCFVSFYSAIPNIYIPYENRYLSTTRSKYGGSTISTFDLNYLFLHDSDIFPRCNFYSFFNLDPDRYFDSTIKMIYNPSYNHIKTWDDIVINSNVYYSDVDLYDETINSIRCYDDYQNTDYVTLSYRDDTYHRFERRERMFTTVVPRNLVDTDLTSNPDIFNAANLTNTTRLFRERLRDKYMTLDAVYNNTNSKDKIVLNSLNVTYRASVR